MKDYKDPLHMDPEIYHVTHTRADYYLNKHLLDRQNAWENVDKLVGVHRDKLDLFDEIDAGKWDDRLPEAAKRLQEIEFEMQELWKFDKDANFHEWYLIPKCTCPKMDNRDYQGTRFSVFSGDCPVHKPKEQ